MTLGILLFVGGCLMTGLGYVLLNEPAGKSVRIPAPLSAAIMAAGGCGALAGLILVVR